MGEGTFVDFPLYFGTFLIAAVGQRNAAGLAVLFPSARIGTIGMFFDATFLLYTNNAIRIISSLIDEGFWAAVDPVKASFLASEIQKQIVFLTF